MTRPINVKDNLIALQLPKELKEKTRKAAKERGLNISGFIRLLLIEYLEKKRALDRKGRREVKEKRKETHFIKRGVRK